MVGTPWCRSLSGNSYSIQNESLSRTSSLRWKSHLVCSPFSSKAITLTLTSKKIDIYSRFNKATAPSLIKHYRDCVKGAPRELYANVLLTAGPAGKDSLMVVQMCYVGSREKGQEYLDAILSWDGERCLLNEVDEKSFLHQQDSVAQVLRGKGIIISH